MNGAHPYSFQKTPVFQPFAGLIAIFLGDKEPDCLDGFCDAIAKALAGTRVACSLHLLLLDGQQAQVAHRFYK